MTSLARINSLFFEDEDDRISNESEKPRRRRKEPRMTSRFSMSRSGSDEKSSLRTLRSKRRLCFDAIEEQPCPTFARESESDIKYSEMTPFVRLTTEEKTFVKRDVLRKPFGDLTNQGENSGTGVTNPSRYVSLNKDASHGIHQWINKENEGSIIFKSNRNHPLKDVKQNVKVKRKKCLEAVDLGKADLAQEIDDILNTDQDDAKLNGDYSSSCTLPLVRNERHPELKTISTETVGHLYTSFKLTLAFRLRSNDPFEIQVDPYFLEPKPLHVILPLSICNLL